MRPLFLAALCLALAACGADEGKRIAAASLRDPRSAQFQDVQTTRLQSGGVAVCGEINGKNAFGAYVGFKRFVVWDGDLHMDPAGAAELTAAEQEKVDRAFGLIWAMCRK
jgi:hypothetical protein